MDIEQFRKAGYQAVDRICDYYANVQKLPVLSTVKPGYLKELIPDSTPEQGEDFQSIADDFQKIILPGMTHWQHPSFFAYFPTASSFEGMLAELYQASVSTPGFNWNSGPAATELEVIVMDWLARMFGLSPSFYNSSGVGGGCLQQSASDSALISTVAARSLYQRKNPGVPTDRLVIYTTTQTHSLGAKAGLVLGLRTRALEVKPEDNFSLRGDVLRQALEEDGAKGDKPCILIASLGTTSSGAIDNFAEIKQVAKDYPDLWIHVDAAWAGCALACPETRSGAYLDDINEFAHSFATNMHKWGLVPWSATAYWVRDRQYLTDALDVTPPFLRTVSVDAGSVIDYRNWHLGLGRGFKSLKVWFVLRSYGVAGFQQHIRRAVKLNEKFTARITELDNISLVTPPFLALTVFRLNPKIDGKSATLGSLNSLNEDFFKRLCTRQELFLTQTNLNGVHCVRFAVGVPSTQEEHINHAVETIKDVAALAIAEWTPLFEE